MEQFMNITKAMADASRIRIILALTEGELCVCQISDMLNLAPSTVSKHISILRQAGFVKQRKDGRWIYYKISCNNAKSKSAIEWIKKSLKNDNQIKTDKKTLKNSLLCDSKKIKILFLCTGNSCRSQMAEGWAKSLKGDQFEVYSAGIETHGLNKNAIKVMKEVDIDISKQKSENIEKFKDIDIDVVITVCNNAHETCPIFPRNCKVIHVGFDDPPKMAKEIEKRGGSLEEQLDCYRSVRDNIKEFIKTLPEGVI